MITQKSVGDRGLQLASLLAIHSVLRLDERHCCSERLTWGNASGFVLRKSCCCDRSLDSAQQCRHLSGDTEQREAHVESERTRSYNEKCELGARRNSQA